MEVHDSTECLVDFYPAPSATVFAFDELAIDPQSSSIPTRSLPDLLGRADHCIAHACNSNLMDVALPLDPPEDSQRLHIIPDPDIVQ